MTAVWGSLFRAPIGAHRMTPALPSARVAGFVAHLRRSGYRIGPAEAEATLGLLAARADPALRRVWA